MSRQSRAVLLTMVMEMDSTVRKTASGERFNAFAMTAAHRTGPMGSYVRVTNLANGRSVRVRINDRGPARRTGKIIDLSYGASRVIGMGGTARVSVQELAEEAMADKTNFTKEEWTLLLESPMIAGMAVTAADPSGLWGLLKESFAGGSALAQAATSANTSALVKAVVTDFSSSETVSRQSFRLVSHQTSSSKPSARYDRFLRCSMQKLQTMQLRLKLGSAKLVKAPQKRRPRAVACSDLVAFK